MFGCSSARPRDLGLRAGVLRPCPETPNCVSSESNAPEDKRVAPFPAAAGAAEMTRLARLLSSSPRTAIITDTPGYLHAESTSLLLRFVDDLEFRYDAAAGVIQVRSASRIGRSDLGVNRKRVDALRAAWTAR